MTTKYEVFTTYYGVQECPKRCLDQHRIILFIETVIAAWNAGRKEDFAHIVGLRFSCMEECAASGVCPISSCRVIIHHDCRRRRLQVNLWKDRVEQARGS
jgi:hypothetical protein